MIMGLDQIICGYDEDGVEVVHKCYRKQNWLRNWMIKNTALDYDSNTEIVELERYKLRELIETCKYVLNHKNRASEKLETLNGFFFGVTDYDDWYFKGIEQVKDDLEELLNDDELKYFDYWDWW